MARIKRQQLLPNLMRRKANWFCQLLLTLLSFCTVAYVSRFLRHCKSHGNRLLGMFSTQELHKALVHLVNHAQWFCFSDITSKIQVFF